MDEQQLHNLYAGSYGESGIIGFKRAVVKLTPRHSLALLVSSQLCRTLAWEGK